MIRNLILSKLNIVSIFLKENPIIKKISKVVFHFLVCHRKNKHTITSHLGRL